jgi:hypothetical protein
LRLVAWTPGSRSRLVIIFVMRTHSELPRTSTSDDLDRIYLLHA